MLRHLALSAAACSALVLAGCGSSGGPGVDVDGTAVLNTQEDAVDQGISQSTDASTQYLVQASTSSNGSTGPVTNRKPDLTRLSAAGPTTVVVVVSTLVDGNGRALYPGLSGSFTITYQGSAVASWPTGSSAMATLTVTVTFSGAGLTYTDPLSGATATITSGSFTYNLISDFTSGGSANNWTLSVETSTSVPASDPLTWTIAKANGRTHTVTLSGYRHVLWNYTRTDTTGPVINNLVVTRSIDGDPLSGTTAPEGVTVAAYTASPDQLFTNWVHVVDGGPSAGGTESVWNRIASWTVTWDFTTTPITRTLNQFSETIFITRSGKTIETTSVALGADVGG